MDEEMLDPFSRDFARILFAAYPEWRTLAQAVPEPDGGPGALEVTVPAPDGSDLAVPLALSTEGGEVTDAPMSVKRLSRPPSCPCGGGRKSPVRHSA